MSAPFLFGDLCADRQHWQYYMIGKQNVESGLMTDSPFLKHILRITFKTSFGIRDFKLLLSFMLFRTSTVAQRLGNLSMLWRTINVCMLLSDCTLKIIIMTTL